MWEAGAAHNLLGAPLRGLVVAAAVSAGTIRAHVNEPRHAGLARRVRHISCAVDVDALKRDAFRRALVDDADEVDDRLGAVERA